MADLILSNSSRYKDTELIRNPNGVLQFGLFVLPAEFVDSDADPGLTGDALGEAEAPFLDVVAVRRYGPGNESLWWLIAVASGVIDVDRDAAAGAALSVPGFDAIESFRSRPSVAEL